VTLPTIPGSVSVVTGSFNAATWIRDMLESVLGQTYPVSEVIVVDDGSTDATQQVVASYADRGVRFLSEQHRGRPHRNRGIAAASGEFVAFVDADDYWHATKIEKQINLLQRTRRLWAICDSTWLDTATGLERLPVGDALRDGDILGPLFLNNFIVASTPVVSRHALDAVGHFDESASLAPVEDWDLWLRLAGRYPVACVHEPLATLRLHGDSFLAATPIRNRVRSQERVIMRCLGREGGRLSGLKRRSLHNIYHAAGVHLFREGCPTEARPFFIRAWLERPLKLDSLAYVAIGLLGTKFSTALVQLMRATRRRD